jgi:pantoate--beta-alanine ligase
MEIIRNIGEMKRTRAVFGDKGLTVGLVPTMGALHDGHLSLIKRIGSCCDVRIVSIFVNPIQFGRNEDLDKYPKPFEADCEKAKSAGCDVVFAPLRQDMYPEGYSTFVDVENITNGLCGALRPGHFRGVATVVLKFFNIISPGCAIFGQKDAQQVVVLKRMAADLNCNVRIMVAPIVREPDGLAMSSRNAYLTPGERAEAAMIYGGLTAAASAYDKGRRSAAHIKDAINEFYNKASRFTVEYVEVVHAQTLEPLNELYCAALVAVAVRTKESKTRLIDNIVLGGEL